MQLCFYSKQNVDPYTLGICCVSIELPHVLAHVVSTVHRTCRLLVAWKVCAYHHFFLSIWGMNSCSACKPYYFMEKINKKLLIYGRFSMMSNTIYEKINVGDNNFANIFRMDRNSAYVFFLKICRVKYKHFSELRL